MLCGFTKRVSVDVSYLYMNDILEYNPPYAQSDFTCNPGPTFAACVARPYLVATTWPLEDDSSETFRAGDSLSCNFAPCEEDSEGIIKMLKLS